MIGIYKITNRLNNKSYIGQSICIEKRWENHKCKNGKSEYPLYRAFRKYGIENFDFEILEECLERELSERELFYIRKYDSVRNGYNQTENTINPLLDKNIMEKAIKNMTLHHRTTEHREKQSEITKCLWQTEIYREKITKINNTDIVKAKISQASKEMWRTNKSAREKITQSAKKRANTKEFKEQKSKEIKEAWKRGCYDIERFKDGARNHIQKMKTDKAYRDNMIEKFKANRPNSIKVDMIDVQTNNVILTFDKLMDAAQWIRNNTKYIKADYSTINKVCKGRGKTAYGYKWRYSESLS